MDEAGDRQAVLGLVIKNAVSAGDEAPCLVDLVIAPPEHPVDRLIGHIPGDAHQVQGQLGLAPHGVHVAEGVCGGNLAEKVGIVGDGRKEVHRLHQGQLVREPVYRRVVAAVEAHQQIGVPVDLQALQQPGQHPGPHLRPAAGAPAP